jgi:hypothetical protein
MANLIDSGLVRIQAFAELVMGFFGQTWRFGSWQRLNFHWPVGFL